MPRRLPVALLAVAAVLVALRALLPVAIQRYVNSVLDRNERYAGTIGDVDVALWRGAYEIEDVRIHKRSGRVPVPFLADPRVDLSIAWRALFDGALVAEIILHEPQLNFVAGPDEARSQAGLGADWRGTAERLSPLRIDRIEVRDGSVHFRNFHAEPRVDVYLHRLELVAENLSNSRSLAADRVARMAFRALPMNAGRLQGRASIDPFAARPSFDFDGELRGADLTQWNDLLRAYLRADVETGAFSIYAELAAEEGRFDGYVKPFFQDIDVLRFEEESDEQGVFASLWEGIVGGAAELFEDQTHDRVATRIPISGTVEDPRASFWAALGNVLRNAFLEALPAQLENSVGPP